MSGPRQFRFVQFEFPWELGPEPGRYSIRSHVGEGPSHVLVLRTLGAPERHVLRRRRRAKEAPPLPDPEPVVTSRATLVDTDALDDPGAAAQWLKAADLDRAAGEAAHRLNQVLHAHRVASADPHCHEVTVGQALVVRVGHGEGEDVAEGRWSDALELPRPSEATRLRPARAALRPQERLAALLGGRDAELACEELALRARADVDAGRLREAALQLDVAVAAAVAELEPWRERPMVPVRLDALREQREAIGAVAGAALQGGLDAEQAGTVREGLRRLEAALRARTADGFP